MAGAIVKAEWLSDARKIPDEVMNYLRRIAVHAIEEKHYSPELIAAILGISRSSIYEWRRWYHTEGEAALDTRTAPGAPPVITPLMDGWLKPTVLHSTSVDQGYDTLLWTRAILVELLHQHFGIGVSEATVGLHLHPRDVRCQTPRYRAVKQELVPVERFLQVTCPPIQRLAQKLGADIGFEDAAGVKSMTRSGRPWGEVGQPPEGVVSDHRGG